jgi:hypothetical protein
MQEILCPMESPTDPLVPRRDQAEAREPEAGDGFSQPPLEAMSAVASDRRAGIAAVLCALAYLALFPAAQRLPYSQGAILATTLVSLPIVLLFTVTTARAIRSLPMLAINTALSGLLFLPTVLILVLHARFPTWPIWVTIGPAFHAYRSVIRSIPDHGLILIWFAACTGVWLSRLVREMKMLLPIAVVLACVDLFSVFGGGVVQQAVQGKSPVAQAAMQQLTAPLPTVHARAGAAPLQLSVGFADYLFIALFFACFARFGIPSRRTFVVLCTVLIAYMTVVYIRSIDLPALVPIAVVVIGMNLRAFRYERSEAFALLYAGLIVAAVAAGLVLMRHR